MEFVPQLVEQSRTIGYLESKNENLEEEKQRLLTTPMQTTPRFIEQMPQSDDTNREDVLKGETPDTVTDSHP